MDTLYLASRTRGDKALVIAVSGILLALPLARPLTDLTSKVIALGLVLPIAYLLCETMLQQLAFDDSRMVYTNVFGKKRVLPYSEVASLRYVKGYELLITAVDGSWIWVTYGDFPRMVAIIGDKTNRKPPLEFAKLSWRFARWIDSSANKLPEASGTKIR